MRWLARVLCWLCWLGVAIALVGGVLSTFNLIPPDRLADDVAGSAFISSSITVDDPSAPNTAAELNHDLLYRAMRIVPVALLVWALLSARRNFIGVGRGEYFSRSTVLGLRNFAFAVLLYLTVAPIAMMIPRALYAARFEHSEFMVMVSLNTPIMLMLIFTGAVALVSTAMAHAAKIAEENRQFI